MEEDNKILEEFIKDYETDYNVRWYVSYNTIQAIKNLIARYKELEEENKSKQKTYDDCYCEYKHYKQFDSIPKSKVEEKIEELKGTEELLSDEQGYWGGSDLLAKIEALQDLLREE